MGEGNGQRKETEKVCSGPGERVEARARTTVKERRGAEKSDPLVGNSTWTLSMMPQCFSQRWWELTGRNWVTRH